jgi:flagellar hook-associated protein 1 FlgK
MAGLFESLSVATSGLTAARLGLDVAGQNIANINTTGYSRRVLSLAERAPVDILSAGRGVDVLGVHAVRDQYIEARLGREQAETAYDRALLDGLAEVEGAIGQPGSSIDARLAAFFDSFSALAVDVTSPVARDAAVRESQLLAREINDFDSRLAESARTADRAILADVETVRQLAARIADLNGQIAGRGAEVETLIDQRNAAIAELAALADVSVIQRGDGLTDVALAGGGALVVGATAYAISTVPTAPDGHVSLRLHDQDVTGLVGGRLGGLVSLRDSALPAYRASLDALAYDLAAAVNAAHTAGFDANGDPAGPLFDPLAGVAGAAAALRVSSAVAADSRLVAGSGTGAAGDNQAARSIAALRDGPIFVGSTATAAEAWAQFVYQVGSDMANARASNATREQVVRQLQQLRDAVSGVSLDEEAAHLMRYQRSFEASARYFTTIVDTLDTLMQMVR